MSPAKPAAKPDGRYAAGLGTGMKELQPPKESESYSQQGQTTALGFLGFRVFFSGFGLATGSTAPVGTSGGR